MSQPEAASHSIAIAGTGVISGAGRGPQAFWDAMAAAKPGQSSRSFGDTRLEPARYVSIPEAHRKLSQGESAASWGNLAINDALENAGPRISQLPSARVAFFVGSSLGGMSIFEKAHRRWTGVDAGPGLPVDHPQPWQAFYDGPTHQLGCQLQPSHGSWTINTACSSATNALGYARLWLLRDRIDIAIVVGLDAVSPFVYSGFHSLRAVDSDPTQPFSEQRRGLNLGEAAAAFILIRGGENTQDCTHLVGFGSSCDAHHLTRPDPSGGGLARAIRHAIKDAHSTPGDIAAISAHGTGTPLNDPMEAAAFSQVFETGIPPIHCSKPVSGHTLGAAGAIDALVLQLALEKGELPPSYCPAPDYSLPCHPSTVKSPLLQGSLGLSTSSGFGGSNAAVILQGPRS